MNDNVRAWIARLESDEMQDRQTTKQLGTVDGKRCCLGVACDLAVEAGVIPAPEAGDSGTLWWARRDSDLPMEVRKWLGLATANGAYAVTDRESRILHSACLSQDNDTGQTFRQIAATIKAAPPGLFE